jgi:hypothetical protein
VSTERRKRAEVVTLAPDDETAITEISILPDGRVCVFGASRRVLAVLAELESRDDAVRERAEYVEALDRDANQTEMRSKS